MAADQLSSLNSHIFRINVRYAIHRDCGLVSIMCGASVTFDKRKLCFYIHNISHLHSRRRVDSSRVRQPRQPLPLQYRPPAFCYRSLRVRSEFGARCTADRRRRSRKCYWPSQPRSFFSTSRATRSESTSSSSASSTPATDLHANS